MLVLGEIDTITECSRVQEPECVSTRSRPPPLAQTPALEINDIRPFVIRVMYRARG